MKSKTAVRLGVLVMLMGFAAVTWRSGHSQGSDPPAPVTQPIRLFSLTYGTESGQINLRFPTLDDEDDGEIGTGPTDFKVSWDGNAFYFAKANMRQVKVFNRQGQLTRTLMTDLKQLDRIAVAPSGDVYLFTGSSFEVFDAQGQRQPERARTLESATKDLELLPQWFITDGSGNLYVGVSLPNEQEVKMVRITPQGQTSILRRGAVERQNGFIWHEGLAQPDQVVAQEVYGPDGQLFATYEESAFAPEDVIVYNGDGQEVRRFRFPVGGLNQVEQSLCLGWEASQVDSNGRMYIVAESRRQDEVIVEETFTMRKYFVVLSYDGQGNRVGVRAVYNKPRYGSSEAPRQQWDVDQAGNVYYLDFKADHVDVMMAPAP